MLTADKCDENTDQKIAPNINPTTVPKIETVIAMVAKRSFLVLAIAERIIAAGPNKTGKNINDIAPNEIPRIEKVLVFDCVGLISDTIAPKVRLVVKYH